MDVEEVKKVQTHDSTFAGAILMSNRETKLECLQRKLFGLPLSKSRFIKQIKVGMLLFLFEHEERKLYGVFEATSDGALNIEPSAFLSSGKSFPAQVLFKRIWMCRPLSEDEFYDAIKDNYYAQKKFHFGLSCDQVFKLVQFFREKRINVKQYKKPGIPNEIITHFEGYVENKVRVTGHDVSPELESDEYSRDNSRESKRNLGLSGSNINNSISSQKLTREHHSLVDNEHQLYQMAPTTEAKSPRWLCYEPNAPYLTCSTSPNEPSSRKHFPMHPMYDGYRGYYGHQGSEGESAYSTPGVNYSPLPEVPNMESHQFDSQLRTTHMDPSLLCHRPPYLLGSSLPICNPPKVSVPPVKSEGCFDIHTYKHISDSERYDPSNPRISFPSDFFLTKGNEMLPSVRPSNCHGYTEASREEFELGGQPCGNVHSPPDYIPFPVSSCFNKNLASSYSNNSWKDTSITYSSESAEDDDSEGIKPYLASRSEGQYPKFKKSKLRSDTEQSRTSVFSRLSKPSDTRHLSGFRLSKTAQARHLSKSQKTFKYGTQKPVVSPSLDYHATSSSQSKKKLIAVAKVPKQHDSFDEDKNYDHTVDMERNKVTSSGELEMRNDATNEEAITENVTESSEHLFMNFKRKSEFQRLSGENEMKRFSDSGLDKETPQKCKRRKLLRPSFSKEEHQEVLASTREDVGFNIVIDNSELSLLTYLDNENKNSSVSVTDLQDVASEKMDNTSESSRTTQLDSDGKKHPASEGSLVDIASGKSDKTSEVPRYAQVDVKNNTHPASVTDLHVVESEKRGKTSEALKNTQLNAEKKNYPAAGSGLGELALDQMDKTSEICRNTQLDAENKKFPTAEGGLGNIVSYKSESSSENISTRKKEVTNRNLRWFLKKSVDVHAKGSSGSYINEKTKDGTHMVTELSDMPAESKHGD